MKKLILSLIVLSILTISCKSKKNSSKMQKIDSGEFAVVQIDGVKEVKNNPTINIDFINNRISGSSACNQYGGDFTTKDNNIEIKALMATKRYCKEFAKIESAFLKNLSLAKRYEIKDNKILLYNASDKVVIVGELVK